MTFTGPFMEDKSFQPIAFIDYHGFQEEQYQAGTRWHDMAAYQVPENCIAPSADSFSTNSSTPQELSFSKQDPDSYFHHGVVDTLSKLGFGFVPPAPTYPGIQQAIKSHVPIPPAPPIQDKMNNPTRDCHTDQNLQDPGILSKSYSYQPTQKPSKGQDHERKPKILQQDRCKKSREKRKSSDNVTKESYLKHLERNRLAATKCRHRKRDEALALASREERLADQHRKLSSHFNDLKEELYQLKTEVLRHSDCECAPIQQYIANEAQRAVDDLTCHSFRIVEHSINTISPCQNNNGSYGDTPEGIAESFRNIPPQRPTELFAEGRIGDKIMHELLQSYM
ncbi:hypothetical protein IL306_009184 [Fusarium sp. DS 682]|nr:hypothetical protein IL306_009184 [Fusarium sp. DS 682]